MKNTILVFLIVMTAIFSIVSVSAIDSLSVDVTRIEVDDMDIATNAVAGEAGEVVPVDIYFTAGEEASDVQVSAWIRQN